MRSVAVLLLALALVLPAAAHARAHHYTHRTRRLLRLARARQRAAVLAWHFVGVPYVWGGESPRGFDCSGLVTFVMRRVGINAPHWTWWQIRLGVPVARKALRVGDVVFFHGGRHEGLVLDRRHYIEAPHTGANVRIRPITRGTDFYAIRRFR